MASLLNSRVNLLLRFFALCAFVLSVYYPQGYYATCHLTTDISWFQEKSFLFYGVLLYLLTSFVSAVLKYEKWLLIPDLCFLMALLYYFLFDFVTGSILHGGANLILDYFFSSLSNILTQDVACGRDVGLHYENGYLFYIAFIISFSLSALLGLVLVLKRPREHQQ
ncbi:hypothetical protein HGO34_00760 [Agrobacterium vitis]|uniref:Uncharacterized protein n=1 Tax=Agrobacterium vitis TaxID=373 RepID=A0AAE5AUJ8_AGRVI|nr:hypothetical protein [Agrobacterium vitis]MCF1498639.1 hypothetical protein [Allorhizobium sp. Av2]MBF2715548.1 hypothetical protein [Agrobacterium vitis]MCM2438243.1 hypothetical protein [Agrobacterium vitis]MUZ56376.1 hypothetical protein [Agrobacterium vitis]MUZ63659.1 hypothetical protein [Agrobacterium vitis]